METIVKRKMFIEIPITVKTYDTDYMQIVSNTVHVKWFEDMRMVILDKYFPLKEMLADNKTPILSETNIKYLRPITLNNKLTGRAWICGLGKSKWNAKFEILENDILYCQGSQEGYYFDLKTNRPARFPQSFVDYYNSL